MKGSQNSPNIMVFSVALNGYQYLHRKNISSHKYYAKRFGYDYECVKKPFMTRLGMECAWLKIELIIRALRKGYDWVVFLDADTLVKGSTPAINSLEVSSKNLYVAKGFSGRLNSGVLIIKNSAQIQAFFEHVLDNAEKLLPAEDDVGWGENGHLIHFAKGQGFVQFLDQRWNNNADPHLDDYIRHFSSGPLHYRFKPPIVDYLGFLICHYGLAIDKRLVRLWRDITHQHEEGFHQRLAALANQVAKVYPQFDTHDVPKNVERKSRRNKASRSMVYANRLNKSLQFAQGGD